MSGSSTIKAKDQITHQACIHSISTACFITCLGDMARFKKPVSQREISKSHEDFNACFTVLPSCYSCHHPWCLRVHEHHAYEDLISWLLGDNSASVAYTLGRHILDLIFMTVTLYCHFTVTQFYFQASASGLLLLSFQPTSSNIAHMVTPQLPETTLTFFLLSVQLLSTVLCLT